MFSHSHARGFTFLEILLVLIIIWILIFNY
ncbi:prepilin-type N-terminal cleavage/methylation domain-containing protein [Candidatus Coxiella mudrowiae]